MKTNCKHPRHGLNSVIHSPVRLSIMAALASGGETDFHFLRDTIEVSDSLLSKHISTLESAGFVEVIKGYVGKRPCTWYTLTEKGSSAFRDYRRTLKQIVENESAD
jgi:DNA-binding MarR family transcriptional regulator